MVIVELAATEWSSLAGLRLCVWGGVGVVAERNRGSRSTNCSGANCIVWLCPCCCYCSLLSLIHIVRPRVNSETMFVTFITDSRCLRGYSTPPLHSHPSSPL